jgi:hypothetical protein
MIQGIRGAEMRPSEEPFHQFSGCKRPAEKYADCDGKAPSPAEKRDQENRAAEERDRRNIDGCVQSLRAMNVAPRQHVAAAQRGRVEVLAPPTTNGHHVHQGREQRCNSDDD